MFFLLVYNRPSGKFVEEPSEFSDHTTALRARFEVERTRYDKDHEVVVLSGESLESLRQTHAHYFPTEALTDA